MILDALIALIVSIVGFLVDGLTLVFVPVINFFAAAIEMLVSFFVSGFSMGRLERKKFRPKSTASTVVQFSLLLVILGTIGWFVIEPLVFNRQITLVAKDGNSLPFAKVIIQTEKKSFTKRTNDEGEVRVPRFDLVSLTVSDPRYVEQTWEAASVTSELKVGRSVLGTSLDSIAEKLRESSSK